MVMITSTPDRDTLSRLDRRPLSFGDASWDAGASTAAAPDAATERWSGGFGDAYDGTPYGPYAGATLPAPPPPEPSRSERIADYWRLYSGSPSAIISGMTAVGVSVAELAEATGQSADAVGRYLQAGGAADGFGGWYDPAIAAAAAAAERRSIIVTYWSANKNNRAAVILDMGIYHVSAAELAEATGQSLDQVNLYLYPPAPALTPASADTSLSTAPIYGPSITADSTGTSTTASTILAGGTSTSADTSTSTIGTSTTNTSTTVDVPSGAPNLVTNVPTSSPSLGAVLDALITTAAPLNPADAAFWTLDYAEFTGQMETRLGPDQTWANPNGDGGDMVRFTLPNGQSFMVSGGDSYVYGFEAGHGPTPVRSEWETESGMVTVDDPLEQAARRWGLWQEQTASPVYDTSTEGGWYNQQANIVRVGETESMPGHDPIADQAAADAALALRISRDALWDAIAKKDSSVTGMDWSQPYWEISTDLSEVLGQDTSRWHAVLRYQREGDKLVLRGDPSMYFQPSIGHENVMGVLSVVGAALSGFLAPASGGAGAATAGAGEAATGAGFNAALDSHLANVLIEAGGGNALAGYAGTVLSAAVPATTTAAAASGLAGLGTQLGTALGLGQYAATGGNFLIRVGIQTLANGGDWKSAVLGAVGGGLGGEAVKLLEGAGMTGPLFTVLGQATGSILIGQDPMQALLGSGLNEGLTGLTGQIPGFNNLPDVVKNTVVSTMSGLLQGQDVSVSLLNTALTAGLDVAVRGVQAGNANTNNNTITNTTNTNTQTSPYANLVNYFNGSAGLVFEVGTYDEATNTWATNTWATTMGDGNDGTQGTQGTGDWSNRDYVNGWDVQSDLASTADAGNIGGTPINAQTLGPEQQAQLAGLGLSVGTQTSADGTTQYLILPRVNVGPVSPQDLLDQDLARMQELGQHGIVPLGAPAELGLDLIDTKGYTGALTPAQSDLLDQTGFLLSEADAQTLAGLRDQGLLQAFAPMSGTGSSGVVVSLGTLSAGALNGARVWTLADLLASAPNWSLERAATILARGGSFLTLLLMPANAQQNTVELNQNQRFVGGVGSLYGTLEKRDDNGNWVFDKSGVRLVQIDGQFVALTPQELDRLAGPITNPLPEPQPVGPPVLPITDQQTTTTTSPVTPPMLLGPDGLPMAEPTTPEETLVYNQQEADEAYRKNPNLRSPGSLIGNSDGGPGEWGYCPTRSGGKDYQEALSNVPRGIEYKVNDVWFDNFDRTTGRLIDTKEWVNYPPVGADFWEEKAINEAWGQLRAAAPTGATIEWQVATPEAADKVRKLFNNAQVKQDNPGIDEIIITVVPKP